jgi:predicted P-loop ATPase/GTPase
MRIHLKKNMITNQALESPIELVELLKNDVILLRLNLEKYRIYSENPLRIVVDTKSKMELGYKKEVYDLLNEVEFRIISRRVEIVNQFYKRHPKVQGFKINP